jgi:hypothetical protein
LRVDFLTILALSPEKNRKEQVDPIGTVDRLMLSEKEKQMRLGYLRKKKFLDTVKDLQDRPKITSHPVHNEPHVPIHLRKTPQKTIDDELTERRINNPPPDPHPFEECTFKPNLAPTADKNNQERSINDLLQWN